MSVTKTRSCSPSHYLGRIQQGPAEECKVNLVIGCSDSRKQNVTSHIHTPLNPLQQDDLHHEAEEPRGLAFEKQHTAISWRPVKWHTLVKVVVDRLR